MLTKHFSALTLTILILLFGCSSKHPRIYPDLYASSLLTQHTIRSSFYKSSRIYWNHNFKKVVINGFSTTKQITLPIGATDLDMAKSCLTNKFYATADSLGKAVSLNKSNYKFDDMIYFYDSAFLDSLTQRNYKLFKKDFHLLEVNQPKIKRRSDEH
jgi:hypothetical protein